MNDFSNNADPKPDIPDELASKWQRAVDRVASRSEVKAVLVVRFDPPQAEVLVSSRGVDNPYKKGERLDVRSGLYCEWILKNRTQLLVSDARTDSSWGQKPDARRGMVWHLGLPVQWSDGELFGAIYMLDGKTHPHLEVHQRLIHAFKDSVDSDLALLLSNAERKRAEEAHQASRQEIQDILESVGDGFLALDNDLVVTYVNAAAEKQLGRRRGEVLGRRLFDAFPEARGSIFEEYYTRAVKEKTRLSFEVYFGVEPYENWYEVRVCPRDDGLAVFFQVTTERREAAERIRSQKAFLESVLESLPHPFYVIDAEDHTVKIANSAARRFGPLEENTTCYALTHNVSEPCGPENPLCPLEEVKRTGRPVVTEHIHSDQEGNEGIYEVHGFPIFDSEGKVVQMIVFSQDITDRKRAEEERRRLEARVYQGQKMESLGVLAGGIAHDFNNILTGILGSASLALLQMSHDAPARNSVETIERAAVRAAELSKQMLAYSGRGRFVIQAVDLSSLVKEMVHLVEAAITENAVIRFDLKSGLSAVEVDVVQVRQVVMNLIINASEAVADQSGYITVRTTEEQYDRAYLDLTFLAEDLDEGSYVCLEVSDTGCGMTDEQLLRMFDPFYTTKSLGRGLGLAAVMGIVRGHGGALRVRSEPGQGTTFKILLPASARPVSDAGLPDAGGITDFRGEGTILVVDDEAYVRSVARQALEMVGFRVLTADDGRQALEVYRKHVSEVVLVVLDMTMPHMGGDEAFRRLREIRHDVLIILTSGYNEQEVTARFAGRGLGGFIQKPYTAGALVAAVKDVLKVPRG